MRKLILMLMMLPLLAGAAEGDLREIKLGAGATKYQMLTPFPAAGVKCLRYMDGADGSMMGRALGCFRMGPQFVIDANGVLTVPVTQGATGATGPAGPAGTNGTNGAQGVAGAAGATGATGAQGIAGTNGTPGATGAQGIPGQAGADGAPGATGAQGIQGVAGAAAVIPARVQSGVTRTLGTIFQPSATRDVLAMYTVQITTTSTIASGQNGEVVLEMASNAAFTTNVQTVGVAGNSQVYTLAVTLQGVQIVSGQVSGFIPAGYYARLRTVSITGTPTFAYRAGQEIAL